MFNPTRKDENVRINKPLSNGKFSWKIKLLENNLCIIGVCHGDYPLNIGQNEKLWGFCQYNGNKLASNRSDEWRSASKEGDVIEVRLEFIQGKGSLGFSRN